MFVHVIDGVHAHILANKPRGCRYHVPGTSTHKEHYGRNRTFPRAYCSRFRSGAWRVERLPYRYLAIEPSAPHPLGRSSAVDSRKTVRAGPLTRAPSQQQLLAPFLSLFFACPSLVLAGRRGFTTRQRSDLPGLDLEEFLYVYHSTCRDPSLYLISRVSHIPGIFP